MKILEIWAKHVLKEKREKEWLRKGAEATAYFALLNMEKEPRDGLK